MIKPLERVINNLGSSLVKNLHMGWQVSLSAGDVSFNIITMCDPGIVGESIW